MDARIQTASPQDIDVMEDTSKTELLVSEKISAYYSLIFPNFTYYLQTLSVTIGRRCIPAATASSSDSTQVDVDLGPLKSVSRLHAKIEYEEEEERFVLVVIGRNGAWVDGVWSGSGSRVALSERSQIQIASRTFHFVLPPPPAPEDTPSPSSNSSAGRRRSPSVDITSISPPSSLTSHSPPPVAVPPPQPKIPPLTDTQLPNSNAIGKSKNSSKKRKKSNAAPPPLPPPPRPEEMPPKPSLTRAQLIFRAIKALGGKATLQEITQWIMETFDYYRWCDDKAWMSSIRHNLSSGSAFKKMERCGGDRGKGFFWSIDEDHQQALEEQEAKAQSGAQTKGEAGGKDGSGKTNRKKDKAAALLEPPLKRSVRGDLKGAPLPPPLTSTPLPLKTTPFTPVAATTAAASPPTLAATAPAAQHTITTIIQAPHQPAPVKSEHSAAPLSATKPYAPSQTQQTPYNPYASLTQPPRPSSSTTPAPTSTPQVPPTNASTSHALSSVPPSAITSSLSALPASVHVPIIVGPLPPSHPASSSSKSSAAPDHFSVQPIVLHENALILNPEIFSHLTPQQLRELEALGAQKALEILQVHIVRFLKEKRKAKRVRKARGGANALGSRDGANSGGAGNSSAVPVQRNSGEDKSGSAKNPNGVPADVDMKPPVPVPIGAAASGGNADAEQRSASPILVVDGSDDEGPAVKRRKVGLGSGAGMAAPIASAVVG